MSASPTSVQVQRLTPEIVELPERRAAAVRIEGRVEELPRLIGEAFSLTAAAIGESGAVIAGHPFARYFGFGERIVADVGFPISGSLVPADRVHEVTLPGGRLVTVTHVGPCDEVGAAWRRTTTWLREHDLEANGAPWEC